MEADLVLCGLKMSGMPALDMIDLTQRLIVCLLTELCGFTVLISNLLPFLRCCVRSIYSFSVVTMQILSFSSYRCKVIGFK